MSAYLDRLSFQLYSARSAPRLDDALATLAGLGFRFVETYGGLHGDPPALARALRAHGLSAPSAHVALADMRADLDAVIQLAETIGAELLVAPFLAPEQRPADAEGWRALGRELGRLAGRLAAHGFKLAWHNHAFELAPLADGSFPIDHLLAHPRVGWQVDIGWVARAGHDPLVWLAKYAARIPAVHIKDIAPAGECADEDGWSDIGHGVLDWPTIAPACMAAGVRLLALEHDKPSDPNRFAARSIESVKAW